jgi:hypothetical protein
MGFIYDNTNTFEVYLTDLGKQKFFDGGFKDSITYFSLVDDDVNYDIFEPAQNEVLTWVSGNTYNIGDVIKYNNKFYRKTSLNQLSPLTEYIPTNLAYWDEIRLFDSTNIGLQPISTINHVTGITTSLANGSTQDDDFSHDVFIQTTLRGKKVDNIIYRRALLGVKTNTQKNYILQEPDLNSDQTISILTYIKNE